MARMVGVYLGVLLVALAVAKSNGFSGFNRSPPPGGPNVCGSRHRTFCCPGWSQKPGNNLCIIPVCVRNCGRGGRCVRPNLCMCIGGNISPVCGMRGNGFGGGGVIGGGGAAGGNGITGGGGTGGGGSIIGGGGTTGGGGIIGGGGTTGGGIIGGGGTTGGGGIIGGGGTISGGSIIGGGGTTGGGINGGGGTTGGGGITGSGGITGGGGINGGIISGGGITGGGGRGKIHPHNYSYSYSSVDSVTLRRMSEEFIVICRKKVWVMRDFGQTHTDADDCVNSGAKNVVRRGKGN
ncbi:loricrin-like [Penaeus indicus]|uniref:loricrin-like n=1 Tax=Penaeus indicus TaxID=29960 RepID=UPI00300CA870